MKRGFINMRVLGSCSLIAILVGIAGCAIVTTLMLNDLVGDDYATALVCVLQSISAFAGGLCARQKEGKLLVSILAALISFIIMMVSGMLFFAGEVGHVVRGFAMYGLGGCVAGIIPKSTRKPSRRWH